MLSLGAEREYAGNVGYADELDSVYRYDSFVPNHLQVTKGDLLILCDRKAVLGIARISRIASLDEPKKLRRCPDCGIATIKERKKKRPRFRCWNGHEFDEPKPDEVPSVKYEAYFDGAFQRAPGHIPVQEVRRACPIYNAQLSMQKVDLARLEGPAKSVLRLAETLPEAILGLGLVAEDSSEEPYVPNERDERKRIARQIRERRGQGPFRQGLRERFGDTCLVTRCRLPDLLEAAHISPYRGEKDNHPSNGLLLRADIHTLFDLDLLGINPETLQISLHPRLSGMGYETLAGAVLACDLQLLSRDALELRWRRFQAGLSK
ncbi:HNH endonuclease [Archangium lansingense]|uniref:HNH endonuclease signature motif containing protein n=1 Tax=Archangium lansingense TaxID=2995310 RepID=A0ABT4AF95_9BACT|nr:HNH endonuclease signature motif containing protein [Archangium lansinium]MCY1080348.1 HNH endonuclease signature motif containing protein [Archangium lansinium]